MFSTEEHKGEKKKMSAHVFVKRMHHEIKD